MDTRVENSIKHTMEDVENLLATMNIEEKLEFLGWLKGALEDKESEVEKEYHKHYNNR